VEIINVNALGTYYVLEAARLFGVKKVIFTSFNRRIRCQPGYSGNEDTVQRPTIIYGVTKSLVNS